MNKLQIFMAVNHGYLTLPRLAELIELDRLCPILVRCGQCRFTCGAQDVEHLLRCIELGGDYVRDVSFPVGSLERAALWQDPDRAASLARHTPSTSQGDEEERRQQPVEPLTKALEYWQDYGGVFDAMGNVSSDADSGL